MKILVCLKAVPAITNVKINPETNTLIRSGIENIINPFDTYALDLAIRIRAEVGGTITILSMGIPAVASLLKQALYQHIDQAVLLTDRALAGADSLATSYTLAQGVRKLGGADLILCGKQSTDGDTAQVGPGLAEVLGIPHLTYVSEVHAVHEDSITVKRRTVEVTQLFKLQLPALITVIKGKHVPRLPSLGGYLLHASDAITTYTAGDLTLDEQRIGLTGSPTQVVRVYTPPSSGLAQSIAGTAREQASQLKDIINLSVKLEEQ